MALEHTRIIALEPDHAWVEMIQQTSCQACSARKGCGQGSLAEVIGGKRSQLKVPVNDQQYRTLAIGQWVDIEVAETTIIYGALWVYMMPLVLLVSGALLAGAFWSSIYAAPLGAIVGFSLSIVLIKWQSAAPGRLEFLSPKPYLKSETAEPVCRS